VADPNNPGTAFSAIDCHVNPLDPQHMSLWRSLARQSHWHLILIGATGELVDLFEFPNTYGLAQGISQVDTTCQNMPHGNFDLAKEEFCTKYTIIDLLRL
jgi:hypothetical protein